MEPPPGINPNQSRQPIVFAVTSAALSIAFIAVSLRVYTRAVLLRHFGSDDWACIVSFLLTFLCGFCVAIRTKYGLGKHLRFVEEEQLVHYLKFLYLTMIFYNAALAGIKMTFLLQYYRVFTSQTMPKIFIATMAIVGAWSTGVILLTIFCCTPIPHFWDRKIPGTCVPFYPGFYITAAGNIITDIIILVLPLPVISNLNLNRRQKYLLFGIFGLGFFTCSFSIIRLRYLTLTADFTWSDVSLGSISVAELCCGITCACLATLRPLIPHGMSRFASASNYIRQSNPENASNERSRDIELGRARRGLHSSESKNPICTEANIELSDSRHNSRSHVPDHRRESSEQAD